MKPNPTTRRRHGAQFKAQVVRECEIVGASVAAVARAHGLNANLVHKWRRQGQSAHAAHAPMERFIALPLAPGATPAAGADIRIELRRGALAAHITWPVATATQCGAWLRELLR